ncbi:MAG: helix-hairpin-helix domain-containing protein [Roseivirga sp.]|nr:helix-hairpin-helix domain-containing protein [Roseivirga sp.]
METNGFLVLVPLMVIILFLPGIYVSLFSKEYDPYKEDIKIMDSLMAIWDAGVIAEVNLFKEEPEILIALKPFDPNRIGRNEMRSLGIPDFLTRRIDNYRKKGGKFKVKNDLARIYDFPDSLFNVLESYIELPDKIERRKSEISAKSSGRNDSNYSKSFVRHKKESPKLWIDLNEADTMELRKLKGIGPSFSRRIVKYRSLLGGFITKDQLTEVYGLSDSLYTALSDQIYVGIADSLVTINVNLASYETLKKHPYISYKVAREILKSRSKIGKFRSLQDLKVVQGLDSVQMTRLDPYITY